MEALAAVSHSSSQPANMVLLTETVLYYLDCLDQIYQSSLETTKDGFTGVGPVIDWAEKIASSKPLHPLLTQPSLRTVSGSAKGPRVTPASSTHPSTPISAITSESQHSNLYVDSQESEGVCRHKFTTVHDIFYSDLMVLRTCFGHSPLPKLSVHQEIPTLLILTNSYYFGAQIVKIVVISKNSQK